MELTISIIALVVSVGAGLSTLAWAGLEGRRQHIREVEQFYLTRYWHLQDESPVEVLLNTPPSGTGPRAASESTETEARARRVAILYLRMCDDEVRTRSRGLVSDKAWEEWLGAMQTQVQRWPVREVWESVHQEAPNGSYTELRRALRSDGGDGYRDTDPCDWRGWTRYWRGLCHTPIRLWGPDRSRFGGPWRKPVNYCAHDWK